MGKRLKKISLWLAVLPGIIYGGAAFGFGTIARLGQNAEHERITRHALACGRGLPSEFCFQPKTLDEIAGKSGTFGAVGAPDNPIRGLVLTDSAHCDNGDYLEVPDYPHSLADANAKLISCRSFISSNMDSAVNDAEQLLDSDGRIVDSQIPTAIPCIYNGAKGRAKCNVLEDLGLLLHASQDFYAHSNWNDQATAGPTTLNNPPGLNNPGASQWLNLRADQVLPDGLITGCFDSLSIAAPDQGCQSRVKHEYLNKDKGQIDPTIGVGTTPRGRIGANFASAVNSAIADTQDKIIILYERLIARYGKARAATMMCALSHDDPAETCH